MSARFAPRKPPDGDFAAYVSRSVSYAPYPHRVRVTLHAPVETMAERVPPTAGVLEAIDKRTCRLYTGALSLEILCAGDSCAHLAMIDVDFEVHEPPELVDEIGPLIERLGRAMRHQTSNP